MFFRIKAYCRFLLKATNQHGVHSPFVYLFVTQCLYNRRKHSAYKTLKKIYPNNTAQEPLSYRKRKLLNRFVRYFKSETVLYVGALSRAHCAAFYAGNSVSLWACVNENKIDTEFNNTFPATKVLSYPLPKAITLLKNKSIVPQLIFIASSALPPITSVFTQLLSIATPKSIFLFEGIHLSESAEKEWGTICNHSRVTVTIDLFFWGLVFFKKGQAKQHFKILA